MLASIFTSANVVFASRHVMISREWGTTSLPFDIARPGSILVVAGRKPGMPFILLKTGDKDLNFCATETLRIETPETHRKDPFVILKGDNSRSFIVRFQNGQRYWAFLKRVNSTLDMSVQISELEPDEVQEAWLNFEIPIEIPPVIEHNVGIVSVGSSPIALSTSSCSLTGRLPLMEPRSTNIFSSANVVFASGNVTISREWGTTSLPFNAARPGSVLIIAGEKPGTPFVLLKTHDMDPEFCIVETFRIKAPEVHRKDPFVILMIKGEDNTQSFIVGFPDSEAYWAFLKQAETPKTSMQFSKLKVDDIRNQWSDFVIPFRYPAVMNSTGTNLLVPPTLLLPACGVSGNDFITEWSLPHNSTPMMRPLLPVVDRAIPSPVRGLPVLNLPRCKIPTTMGAKRRRSTMNTDPEDEGRCQKRPAH